MGSRFVLNPKNSQKNHLIDIDILRGIAVLSVVLYHLGNPLFKGGAVGVDLFFVVSGFLITRSVIADIENERFSILNFWLRRARRILPPLLTVILLTAMIFFFVMPPTEYEALGKSLITILFFVQNFHFQDSVDYFGIAALSSPLLHTWSLAIEGHFYLLFPICILWTKKVQRIIPLIILFLSASLFIFVTSTRDQSELFFFPQFRLWEFCVGSLCSLIMSRNAYVPKIFKHKIVNYLGLAGILIPICTFTMQDWPSNLIFVPVISTAIIILNSGQLKFPGRDFVRFFGIRSYSFYLVHYPIICFFNYYEAFSGGLIRSLFIIFIIFIFGFFLFNLVEKRFADRSSLLQFCFQYNSGFFWLVSSLSSCVLLLSLISVSSKGYMFNPNRSELEKIASSIQREQISCRSNIVLDCVRLAPKARVVLVGDSNAYHFSVGLKKISGEEGIVLLTKGGCMPLAEFTRLTRDKIFNQECLRFNDEVRNFFLSETPIGKGRIVVVSAAWLLYLHGEQLYRDDGLNRFAQFGRVILGDNTFAPIPGHRKLSAIRSYLIDLVNELARVFDEVVLLGPLPPQPFDVKHNARYQFFGYEGVKSDLFFKYSNQLLLVFDEISRLPLKNLKIIFPHHQLCDVITKDVCVGFSNGEHYYGDKLHVSAIGQYVAYKELFEYVNKYVTR